MINHYTYDDARYTYDDARYTYDDHRYIMMITVTLWWSPLHYDYTSQGVTLDNIFTESEI